MACGKDLTEGEIVLYINCCVMTEISESVRILEKSFKEGTSV